MDFKRLKQKIGTLLSEQPPSVLQKTSDRAQAEARIHERFPLGYSEAIKITTEKNEVYQILNISFGGFAASLSHGNETFYSRGQKAKIEFLGGRCPALIHKVYQGPRYVGFRFEHRDERTLLFLREILEGLRLGSTLHVLRKEFLTEEYHSDRWICLRGEGPSDLSIHLSPTGAPDQVYFLYKAGEDSFKVEYLDNSFNTDSTGDFAPKEREKLIRNFLCVISGIKIKEISDYLYPVYQSGVAQLQPDQAEDTSV